MIYFMPKTAIKWKSNKNLQPSSLTFLPGIDIQQSKKKKILNHKHQRPRINCLLLLTYKLKINNKSLTSVVFQTWEFCFFCPLGRSNETVTHSCVLFLFLHFRCVHRHPNTHTQATHPSHVANTSLLPNPRSLLLFYFFACSRQLLNCSIHTLTLSQIS